MTIKIFAHNPHSEGARNLAQALGIRRLRHEGSRWRPRAGDTVINWGSSNTPDFGPASIINRPQFVGIVANKLDFFEYVFGPESPGPLPRFIPWTSNREEALGWIRENHKVVARMVLTGHSGRGIIIAESEEELPNAPLYTRYVKKQAEYRVHVVRGRVVDVQRKIRDPDREPTDWQVRSHQNGFIFVRGDVELPRDAEDQCLRAFEASGLDFGAIDVLWNEREGQAYVLEINTAPGLTGQTVTNYAEAFRREFF